MKHAHFNGITIGKLAKTANVNVQTVRYYERLGILAPSERLESGYRIYSAGEVQRLRFIKHAQELGFTLDEIQELLDLRANTETKCHDVKQRAERQLALIQKKIESLQSIQSTLMNLVSLCNEREASEDCPILDCLDECSPSLLDREEPRD